MVNVFPDEVNHGLHRVVVGLEIEIERTTHEVSGAVGEVELHRSGYTFAVHFDKEAVNIMFFVENQAVAHAIGLLQMLGDHRVDIFKIFAQIAVYGLVRQVNGAFELGHFHIDPVFLVGRIRVGGDERVLRALETVFFDGVDFDVSLFRQVDAEIAARLGQRV